MGLNRSLPEGLMLEARGRNKFTHALIQETPTAKLSLTRIGHRSEH